MRCGLYGPRHYATLGDIINLALNNTLLYQTPPCQSQQGKNLVSEKLHPDPSCRPDMDPFVAVLAHPQLSARISEPAVCLLDAQQTLLDTLVVVVSARGTTAVTRDGRWDPSLNGYSVVGLQC